MTDFVSGTDMARTHMVDSQVRPNQVRDSRVISAMRSLDRAAFAPQPGQAYADADISLGHGRYMLRPMLVAQLAQMALATNPKHALVIGAGAGYGAAILAYAGVDVVALESAPELATGPEVENVTRVSGPLPAGWPAGGPYDVILIEGAVPVAPPQLAAQLAQGGQLVALLADMSGNAGNLAALASAICARSSTGGFAITRAFDCTAHMLPEFAPKPEFVF